MVTTSPYGSWYSPISVDDITGATVGLVGGTIDGDDVYWVESHASQGGRASVWRLASDGERTELTPEHYVRSTVHEYGGGAWAVQGGTVVFSHFPTNVVYVVGGGDRQPRAITGEGKLRYGGFTFAPDGRVACVREDHTTSDIDCVNTLVILDPTSDGPAGQEGTVIASGADFYSAPAVAADGRVAWVEWNHPDMPWDSTRVMVGSLDGRPPVQVGGGVGVSAVSPRWDADGSLVFLSDDSGYWNFRRWDGTGVATLHDHPYDFCGPGWILSGAPYALLPGGRIGCSWRVDGLSRVGVLDGQGELTELDLGVVEATVQGGGPDLSVLSLGFAERSAELAVLDWASGATTTIRRASERTPDPRLVSRAREITWEGPQGPVHAWFYPPTNPDFTAPEGELPPLVVLSHGGPTSFSACSFDWGDQYWTSRGIGILDVNYGGSTGYGRRYRERLKGQWGIVDVRDCADGATALAGTVVDPRRLAIKGGSAGGYTTLQALVSTDVFTAGISLYGIGDLAMLATDTHKFESRYLDGLIGPYPEEAGLYEERSPMFHVDRLACPMLILQGTEDRVVPPNQAEDMAAAVRLKGLPVALVMFDGEGHGFRRSESIRASYEAQLSFLGQVYGFTPAGEVAVLKVENL